MILDANTIQVLKNFSTITQSMVFKPGKIQSTMSPSKTILARATFEQELTTRFAIYDLPKFLSVLSLFKDPTIEFEKNYLTIISDKQRIQYMYASEETIVVPKDKDPKLPSVDVTLTLTPETFGSVYKAMGALSLPELAVAGRDGKLIVKAFDSKNSSSDNYQVQIGETDKTFQMIFKAEYLKILPVTYDIEICSKGISKWKGENVTYWIAVETNSTFED